METPTKYTLLHDRHLADGAHMAVFASYDMPLWYPSGTKNEHLAVLRCAGLFDTSHMAVLTIQGSAARAVVQKCFSKDLDTCLGLKRTPLLTGRSVYGVFLDARGHVVDDAIVSQLSEEAYMVVVNAGMGGRVAAHLYAQREGKNAVITDFTDRLGKMDLQGPAAARVMSKILRRPEAVLDGMAYFSFKGMWGDALQGTDSVELRDGTPVMVSRTGYTGEFGFEIYVAPSATGKVWETVRAAGREFGVIPCGLAARDSLRTGAVLPLSHQDIGEWPFINNPWLFALAWNRTHTGFSKEFIGAEAVLHCTDQLFTYPFAGYDPRKINAGGGSFVTDLQGVRIGSLLTCTTEVSLGRVGTTIFGVTTTEAAGRPADFIPKGLCCGFVKVDRPMEPGAEVILTDGKRRITVEIRDDIRPGRTARRPMAEMIQYPCS